MEPSEERRRFVGSWWGLRYEVEECPEAEQADMRTLGGLGAAGFGVGWLLGAGPLGRLLGAAAGVGLGNLASRWHVYLDWDPDRARGEPEPGQAR